MPTKQELFDRLGEAFRPAAPIHNAEFLEGRRSQLLDLQGVCHSAGAHAALFGERGVGKSSVSAVLRVSLRAQGVPVVAINCAPSDEFHSLWEAMFEEWEPLLPEDASERLRAARYSGGLTQQSVVRTIREVIGTNKALLIFDEFDTVVEGSVAEQLSNVMKALSDNALQVHIIVVGIADDVEDLLAGHASMIRSLNEIRLPRLSDSEIRRILERGFEHVGVTCDSSVIERIVNLSNGLPHYAHALGFACAHRAIEEDRDRTGESDWPDALAATISRAEMSISEMFMAATSDTPNGHAHLTLIACALASANQFGFFGEAEVLQQLEQHSLPVPDSLIEVLDELSEEDRGCVLICRDLADGTARYRFRQALLQPYVVVKAMADQIIGDPLSSRPTCEE